MRDSLRKMKQALDAHDKAFGEFCKAQDAVALVLGHGSDEIKQACGGNASITGALGAVAKAVKVHAQAHEVVKAAHASVHGTIAKALDSIATTAGISIADRTNLNAAVSHQGADTASPGVISHCKGYTAKELQKMVDDCARPTLFSQVQRAAGNVNKNATADPFGFAK